MSIGPAEIVAIVLLALVLFGPKRLPEIGRQVGRAVAEVRRLSREFEREVREVAEPIEHEVREATEPFAQEVREAERVARRTYEMDADHSSFLPKPPSGGATGQAAPAPPEDPGPRE